MQWQAGFERIEADPTSLHRQLSCKLQEMELDFFLFNKEMKRLDFTAVPVVFAS